MRLILACVCVLMAAPALAQTTVKNPTTAVFAPGPDAAQVTGYELDIINSAGVVVQTLSFPAQTPNAAGDVSVTFNVQPIAFGTYTARVRNLTAGGVKSADSEPSNVFERSPGSPSKPRLQ